MRLNITLAHKGSVLLLTLMMIVLMTFEVALVSLVVLRGLGDEGVLVSQNISARRAADGAITQLENQIYSELRTTDLATVKTQYALGGSGQASYNNQTLQMTNPATGASAASSPAIYTSAWVDTTDTRGNYFHLVGRARTGSIDILVHRWKWIKPCMDTAGLITILTSDVTGPGANYNVKALPDGRVFFGQDSDPGNFWTWHPSTGLSTLVAAGTDIGNNTIIMVDPNNYRVFFAENKATGRLWTWNESTGLSVIISSEDFRNLDDTTLQHSASYGVDSNGRAYWGTNGAGTKFYTWKQSTGLSELVTGESNPGDDSLVIAPNGRIFFGEEDFSGSFWTWKEDTGLTKIVNEARRRPGFHAIGVTRDGDRVYFGEFDSNNLVNFYTWTYSGGGAPTAIASNVRMPGRWSTLVDSTGRVFFGSSDSTPAASSYYTWAPPAGPLEVIVAAAQYSPGVAASIMGPDDRVYFSTTVAGPRPTWTWKSGVLSTIGNFMHGGEVSFAVADDGRVFFGEDNNTGHMRTWTPADGLSVLSNVTTEDPGENSTVVTPDGRLFWGDDIGPAARFWTWDASTGLSVILQADGRFGKKTIYALDDGTVFFGEGPSVSSVPSSGRLYRWSPGSNCDP